MLLIVSDPHRRAELATTFKRCGFAVMAMAAPDEAPPSFRGQVVVTDRQFYTPAWLEQGAAHVVVLDDASPLFIDGGVTRVPHFYTSFRIAEIVLNLGVERIGD